MLKNKIIPVFIGGCSRSGTTLLGAMLGANSECICTPESPFKVNLINTIAEAERIDTERLFQKLENNWRYKIWNLDKKLVDLKSVNNCTELITAIVKGYSSKVGKTNAHIWIDHTPENIKHITSLYKTFPESKYIHLVRDGRAVAASIMPLDWGPNTTYMAAHWWASELASGLAAESFMDKSLIIRIKFEDLVLKTEETLKHICEFIDMEYQPSMTKAQGFTIPEYSSNQHKLVGKEPDADRINAWRKKLTTRDVEIFEILTGDLLEYLGYELKYGFSDKEIKNSEKIKITLKEIIQHIQNMFRLRSRTKNIGT